MLCLMVRDNDKTFIDCPDGTRITVIVDKFPGKRNVKKLMFEAPREYRIVRETAKNKEPKKGGA